MYPKCEDMTNFTDVKFKMTDWWPFLSPADEVGAGDIVITMSGPASVFRFQRISWKPLAVLFSYCIIHTSLRRCRCDFLGVMTFDLIFDL